ncbi:MAG: enolase C-terminal domain-like protein, partial [Bacteroidota bacterium]
VKELKELPNEIKELIAADESLINPSDAFTLASGSRASHIYNIKLMKSGGIFPARRIATIAQAADIDLMWGCNDESSISITAALHTALSFPTTKYLDLDGSLDLVEDVVKSGFEIKDGRMSVTGRNGLGIVPPDPLN